MDEMHLNWRFLIFYYILMSGLWGFFLKIIMKHLDWKTTLFYVWIGLSIVYFILLLKRINVGYSKFHLFAIFTGIIAALATIAFYKVLSLKPASLVIPLSALYVLITSLLCLIFLKESFTLRIFLGIVFSFISIILLTG